MLGKTKITKIFMSILLVMTIIVITTNVYADINWDYYDQSVSGMTVIDANLDDKVSGSSLLSALGLLVYSVASLLEWLLGSMYRLITGTNIFPWADAVLFNAIPLLDINFINPARGVSTLIGTVQSFLGTLYATLMGIATTFFAIAVMVMAIKLIITTIASEKAKYKEALVQWGMGLLLLYAIHYGISFMFYLNESLVNVASDMVVPYLQSAQGKLEDASKLDEAQEKKAVENFIKSMATFKITDLTGLGINRLFTTYSPTHEQFDDIDVARDYIREHANIAVILLQDKGFTNWCFGEKNWYAMNLSSNDDFWTWSAGDNAFVKLVADCVYEIVNNEDDYIKIKEEKYEAIKYGNVDDDEIARYEYFVAMAKAQRIHQTGETGETYSIVSNLANLFKKLSWETSSNAWRADTAVIQYALLYAILVVQSLILFISYCKRLFYIILLSMLAPIVVAYDFLNKAIGNGKGVLSVWLKEFCQLVFIQTLQAFIYAIIIVLIVNLILGESTTGMTEQEYTTGLGLMAVIALVSVFKIEDLVRKIFGFGATKADHGSAVKSIAKTAFALKLGSKVLDNGKKMITGAGKALKTRGEAKDAREELKEQLEIEQAKKAAGKINDAEYKANIKKLQRDNKKKLNEIKAKRHEGVKDIASGFVETGGAIYGGTAGAIIGGADGNFDEAAQGLLAGMGIGDTIGKAAVNIADFGVSTVVIKGGKKTLGKIESGSESIKAMREKYKTAREEGEAASRALRDSIGEEYKKHFRQISQLEKEIKELSSKVEDIE